MKLARYIGDGRVEIVDERIPACPEGGLVVKTEACGLCSGELMAWYMDRKIPHVLGHEVCGTVVESQSEEFPVGMRVFPHHHAPCLVCEMCRLRRYVHCEQWKRTKLIPGGMAEFFAVQRENLTDTLPVAGIPAVDAALIEPLACVLKSLRLSGIQAAHEGSSESAVRPAAVVGLGVMGLMHMIMLGDAQGYDLNPQRVAFANSIGLNAAKPENHEPADTVFVCPGSQAAFDFALSIARPEASIVMFAPMPPGENLRVPQLAYFQDLRIVHSYSCSLQETSAARDLIAAGAIRARHVVDEMIGIDELPEAYQAMKRGLILKPMVVFP